MKPVPYRLEDYCAVADHVPSPRVTLLAEATAARLAELFKALSDPTRIRLMSALAGSELCVGDLAAALEMEQSAVSHQLRTLRDLRLVRARKVGRHVFYALDDNHIHRLFEQGLDHITHG